MLVPFVIVNSLLSQLPLRPYSTIELLENSQNYAIWSSAPALLLVILSLGLSEKEIFDPNMTSQQHHNEDSIEITFRNERVKITCPPDRSQKRH